MTVTDITSYMDERVKKKLQDFFTKHRQQTFKKGEILIRADDDPSGIYFLLEGIVRQYYISKNGEEITLNMYKPFSFFPMSWTVGDIHNNYYYEAVISCVTHKAPKEVVLDFVRHEPEVLLDLLRRVFIGIEGLWMHIEYLSAGNALTKLTTTLLILGRRFGKQSKEGTVVEIAMSEKELGEYSGMYRETVSREIQVLKKKNLVRYEKGIIIIHNIEKLEEALTL